MNVRMEDSGDRWPIIAIPSSVVAGQVTFNATNAGRFGHELVVIRTDRDPGALPTLPTGEVDENQVTIVGQIGEFEPGTRTLTLNLEPGRYALICNVVARRPDGSLSPHYQRGMFTRFTVTAPGAPLTGTAGLQAADRSALSWWYAAMLGASLLLGSGSIITLRRHHSR